jgi:hypothetical protein
VGAVWKILNFFLGNSDGSFNLEENSLQLGQAALET